MSRPVFLYDGDCGFCRKWVRRLRRISSEHVEIVPWQSANLAALGVDVAACREAVQFVGTDGRVGSGAVAVGRHLRAIAWPWHPFGWLLLAPGVRQIAGVIYRLIARNRHRFRGEP